MKTECIPPSSTQRFYARVAGILFLWLIINGVGGALIFPHIGDGTFAEAAKRITASEHLYRVGLSFEVIETLSGALLAFALYVTLKPVNGLLALLAMIFSLQDSFLAGVVRMCGFVKLQLYTSPQTLGGETVPAQALADLMTNIAHATENIGGILFGIALLLFFRLFLKSRYIPRILSALGLFTSVIWTSLYCANLIFPERHTVFQLICFPLMAIAVVTMGLWLLVKGVNVQRWNEQASLGV